MNRTLWMLVVGGVGFIPGAGATPPREDPPAFTSAEFVLKPEIFVRHTADRAFIGPGLYRFTDDELLMVAPWGRPPTNFDQLAAKFPVPPLYRSTDGGRTWTESGRLNLDWKLDGMISDGGVTFLRLHDGRLAVLAHRHVKGLFGGGLPAIAFSKDHGKSWSTPKVVGGPEGVCYVMNDRMIQTRSGRIVVPVAYGGKVTGKYEEGDTCPALCFFSDDGGTTWNKSRTPCDLADGRGMSEPAVVEVGRDRLLMLARTGSGVKYASWSADGGDTWSKPEPTTLTSACSPHTLYTLPDGRLIVFYNHADPLKKGAFFPRTPLVYAVSKDSGKTWGLPVLIDGTGSKNHDLQHIYPAATFTKEGMVVVYSTHAADPSGSFANGGKDGWKVGGGVRCILKYPAP